MNKTDVEPVTMFKQYYERILEHVKNTKDIEIWDEFKINGIRPLLDDLSTLYVFRYDKREYSKRIKLVKKNIKYSNENTVYTDLFTLNIAIVFLQNYIDEIDMEVNDKETLNWASKTLLSIAEEYTLSTGLNPIKSAFIMMIIVNILGIFIYFVK